MMDLFSSFNPITTSNLSMNWMMIIIPTITTFNMFWKINSTCLFPKKYLTHYIENQFKPSMKKINMPNLITILTIMMTIMNYNLTSLLPNTFPVTSHIAINLSMSLTLWTALMMKKTNKMKHLMSHLTPTNTPMMLIPFMVIIELVSLLIQPITLSVRLTANITAGHIMMILISHLYNLMFMPTLIMNLMMTILELGVSMIQAYVFSMLIIMYMK